MDGKSVIYFVDFVCQRELLMGFIRHVKITALIVTKNGADVRKAIHSRLVRGITTIPQQALIQMKIKKC